MEFLCNYLNVYIKQYLNNTVTNVLLSVQNNIKVIFMGKDCKYNEIPKRNRCLRKYKIRDQHDMNSGFIAG